MNSKCATLYKLACCNQGIICPSSALVQWKITSQCRQWSSFELTPTHVRDDLCVCVLSMWNYMI